MNWLSCHRDFVILRMPSSSSIRRRLTLSLAFGVIVLELIAGAGLYGYVGETLERSLDATLAAKAEAMAAMVRLEENNKPRLHIPEEYLPQYSGKEGTNIFQIWRSSGETLARSPSLGDFNLIGPRGKRRFGDVRLPDGSEVRATRLIFTPQPDEDREGQQSAATKPAEQLQIVLARDTRAIDQPMATLLTGLLLSGLLVTGGVIGIVTVGVRRGLRPLDAIAHDTDRIGPDALDVRFPTETVPAELQPISKKLNELLERLHTAFIRERRFSSDVAHELRTPIAELRSLCEVSLKWPGDAASSAESFNEALAISNQMEAIVTTMLALVRSQVGAHSPGQTRVDLKTLIESLCQPLLKPAADRGVTLDREAPHDIAVQTDEVMLSIILRNLLSNAVEYTPAGGRIQIAAAPSAAGLELRIANTSTGLEADDLPHLFEPFWRKDPARTGGLHTGLGLAIVAAYCNTLGLKFKPFLNKSEGNITWFEIHLIFPADQLIKN